MSSESTESVSPEGNKRVQLGPREIVLPEEWEIAPIKELFDIEKDSFDPSELESDSDVMLYSMPAYDSNREPIRTPASEIGSKKYRVPQDTVLFPKLNIRKRRFWRVRHDHSHPAVCSTEYWPLLPKISLELDFYHYYFDSYEFTSNPKVTSSSSTNSHKRVKQSSFEKLRLPVPPIPEQRRIADILSTVDEQIQQTDESIEKAKELLSGVQQDLFTEGYFEHTEIDTRRLIEAPLNWDIRPLSEFTVDSAYGPRFSSDEYAENGDLATLRTTDLNDDGSINHETMPLADLSPSDFEDHLLEENDFIISRTGAYCGICTVWDGYSTPTVPGAYMIRFRLTDELDARFLRDYLNSSVGSKKVDVLARGSSQKNLAGSDLLSMYIPVPSKEEQGRIVDTIQTVRTRIQDERETKQNLQELKRGLMQDLLTGKVRVNTD